MRTPIVDKAPGAGPARRSLSETLGANVVRLRNEQRLSKKTFALMVGIGRPLLDKIEKGQSDIRLSYVQMIADALSVDPIDLITPPRP